MVGLNFTRLKTVLCLGAHSDDIEIGCGGTILKLTRRLPRLNVYWVVLSAEGCRATEAASSARDFLKRTRINTVMVKDFRTSYFPYQGEAIKEFFEELKTTIQPDVVFTHYRDDRHQDHRVVSDLTWNTFRDHTILEYEVLKYDGDLGSPNCFVQLDPTICREKSRLLLRHFRSQRSKHWFSEDAFSGLMRLRGIECATDGRYAEAYYCRKLILDAA